MAAERVAARYLAVVETQVPVDGSERAAFHDVLAACQLKGANVPSAENQLVQAMADFDRVEAGGVMPLACRVMMGEIQTKRGRFEDAEAILIPARKGLLEHVVKSPKDVRIRSNYLDATVRVVRLYDAWGRPDRAAEYRAKLPREKAPPPRVVGSN